MSDKDNSVLQNLSTTLLFITFLVLKLTHVIDWSWWWITCPLWAALAFALVIILLKGIVAIAFNAGKRARISEEERITPPKQSKFMNKLQEAMDESEKRRNGKL